MLKKTAFRMIPALAAVLLSGCAAGPLLQTGMGLIQGLLGAGAAPGVGGTGTTPLQSPLAGLLPGGGAAPGGPLGGGLGTPVAGGAASPMGQRIRAAAYELPIPFPYKPGTENGNLGCADVVTHALEVAGVSSKSEHQLSVDGARSLVRRKGFTETSRPYADGDVLIWGPLPGGRHQHIGIVVIENGQTYVINNSSSQRKPVKQLLSGINRTITDVWRAPGGQA